MRVWLNALLKKRNSEMEMETYNRAKLVLLDTLGSIIIGNHQKESSHLAKLYYQEMGEDREKLNDKVPIYGTKYNLPYYDAGFINGQSAVAIEMDEGNQYSKGHPAAHVIPVIFTLLTRKQKTKGIDILNALVIGYEICSRFGRAVSLKDDTHAHGTWGGLGAAATTMLFEKDVTSENMEKALLLAASFTLPTQWESAVSGYLVRNLYVGHAIEYGLRVPNLVKSGFESPPDSIGHIFGSVIGTDINTDLLELSTKKWDIEQNYFKPYAYCRYVHAPIEAFQKFLEKRNKEAKQLYPQKIKVLTYKRASSLAEKCPSNVLAAKFSIPYALAVIALYGTANHQAFDKNILNDPNVKEFSSIIEVEYSEELENEYPNKMPAIVEIYDGEEKASARVDNATGGPDYEMESEEIINKFIRLTTNVYEKDTQQQIIQTILNIEDYEFGDLLALLKQVSIE